MMTRALVLHLWQSVAEGGKLVPSPVTAMSSEAPLLAAAGAAISTTSDLALIHI